MVIVILLFSLLVITILLLLVFKQCRKTKKEELRSWKNEGDFKKKKSEARRLSCQKEKEDMTEKESEIGRLKKHLEMWKYRQKKKESPVQVVITCVNAIGSKSSEAKTTKQIWEALPKNPIKKRAVFQKLVVALFPKQTVFKKSNLKNPQSCLEMLKKLHIHFVAVT